MGNLLLEFGKKVKYYRKLAGFSQEILAEKLDLTPTTITLIETGRNFVNYATLENICSVLNVEPFALFDFKSDMLTKENEYAHQISTLSKNLSPDKQKHIIEILKTFQ